MVKKKEDNIIITDKLLEEIQPLRGRVFKHFMKMGGQDEDESTDIMFGVFVKESLIPLGLEIDDPYEDLTLKDFSAVMAKVMEVNNMDELFQTIERLTRFTPK
jgi:hypothetical protein